MHHEKLPIAFFMGANTPQGYCSLFEQLTAGQEYRCFILQGGPGCGKSTLLHRVADAFAEHRPALEYIRCAADPESLDALILPELGVAVADGTAPHPMLPRHPGAVEALIDLGSCLDSDRLYARRGEIVALSARAEDCRRRACTFLQLAAAVEDLNTELLARHADLEKAARLTAKLCRRSMPVSTGKAGRDEQRFLGSITAQGTRYLWETIPALAQEIVLLEDPYSLYAPTMLAELHRHALAQGHRAISCRSPLHPDRIEHLFIPALSLCFTTANYLHTPAVLPTRVINARRFLSPAPLRLHKKALARGRRLTREMLEIAMSLLAEAAEAEAACRALYAEAMDYPAADAITDRLLAQLTQIALAKQADLQ